MKSKSLFYIGLVCVLAILLWAIGRWVDPNKTADITFEFTTPLTFANNIEKKSITKADIQALRDLPVDMGENDTDGVTLTNRKRYDEKKHVQTCSEYDAALAQGYLPASTYDIAMSSYFEYRCGTLNLIKQASEPNRSFLPPPEKLFDLKLLPLALFPVFSDVEQTYGYNIENDTYQNQADKGLLTVVKPQGDWFSVCYEDEGSRQYLTEGVRTDFNGDGIEDVLLYEAVYVTGGSYRSYDLIILTRKSADSKFVIIFRDYLSSYLKELTELARNGINLSIP